MGAGRLSVPMAMGGRVLFVCVCVRAEMNRRT